MANSLSDYNHNVAKILYHAGVAVEMDYGPQGSGAYISKADEALKTYFRFATKGIVFRNDMSEEAWEKLLKTEIDHGRPVLYAGYNYSSGHAFVCDGYDFSDSSDKKFHFNWGWGGYYDGYFSLSALNPGGGSGYNRYNEVIYGIRPLFNMKAPSKLKALRITKTSVNIRWKDMTSNEDGFRIYLDGTMVAKVPANKKQYRLKNLQPGTRYRVSVSAYRGANESPRKTISFKTKGKHRQILLPIRLGESVSSNLTSHIVSSHREGSYARYYWFHLNEKMTVEFHYNSTDYHPYAYILNGKAQDGGVLWKLDFYQEGLYYYGTLSAGDYTIEATSYDPEETGSFTLLIKEH
jgi:hypothetical protein